MSRELDLTHHQHSASSRQVDCDVRRWRRLHSRRTRDSERTQRLCGGVRVTLCRWGRRETRLCTAHPDLKIAEMMLAAVGSVPNFDTFDVRVRTHLNRQPRVVLVVAVCKTPVVQSSNMAVDRCVAGEVVPREIRSGKCATHRRGDSSEGDGGRGLWWRWGWWRRWW